METHDLKCETEYFQAVESGKKKFEIRKNDRDFKRLDLVILHEVVEGIYTGRSIRLPRIQYIMYGPVFGLADGWCIFNW